MKLKSTQYTAKKTNKLSALRTTSSYLRAEVQFGSPTKNCQGVGICRVNVLPKTSNRSNENTSYKRAIALLSLTRDRRLKASFLKESLGAIALKIYFHNNKFVVQDPVTFPNSIAERLDTHAITLEVGVYRVEESERFLTVEF